MIKEKEHSSPEIKYGKTEGRKTDRYIITEIDGSIFSFLLQNNRAVEIHCDEKQPSTAVGDIYIGKIKNIAKNINAAFVEISPGLSCYLPLDELKNPIYTKKGTSKLPQAGDELIVQICREGIKTKLPAVTTNLTLHGKYALLTTGNTQFSVSSKLSKETRERLLIFVREYANREYPDRESHDGKLAACENADCSNRPYGWLLRTNAGTAEEALLQKDMERLETRYETLMQQAQFRTCFSCLHRSPSPYLTRLLDLYDSCADQILTDDDTLFQEIRAYLELNQPEDIRKLSLYRDDLLPLKKLYSLEQQLSRALQERVWLDCGGYLVIQPTEALTVIDVNSGKYEGGKKKEAAFLKINCEAASEIARQIRLRNLSGIIIVDFINMEQQESRETLLSLLDSELRKDPIRTVLVDMTKLSLVEITRMKKEKPLAERVRQQKYEA